MAGSGVHYQPVGQRPIDDFHRLLFVLLLSEENVSVVGMSALFVFSSRRFGLTSGSELLVWLGESLLAVGLIKHHKVVMARAGWSLDAVVFNEAYRLVCADPENGEYRLTLKARRSVIDILLGRRELTEADALLRIVHEMLERQADFHDLSLAIK